MDEFQRVCWHWTYKNTLLEKLFADDERYICVRFEDLFLAQNSETLKKMLTFVEIPYQERFERMLRKNKNASRKTYFPPWDAWESEKQQQMLDICGKKMRQYGYL